MYSFEIWDKISPINGIDATEMLQMIPKSNEDIYLIKQGDIVDLIIPNSMSPYGCENIEEKAKAHCKALNEPEKAQNINNSVMNDYMNDVIDDEKLHSLMLKGTITVSWYDSCIQTKAEKDKPLTTDENLNLAILDQELQNTVIDKRLIKGGL